jgi:hypothetical protein
MKNKFLTIIGIVVVMAMLIPMLPACKPLIAASSYLAVVPSIMHSGRSEAISLSLFSGDASSKTMLKSPC